MAAVDCDSFVLEPNGQRVINHLLREGFARTQRELDAEQGDSVLETLAERGILADGANFDQGTFADTASERLRTRTPHPDPPPQGGRGT